jgi:NUMOD4 motif
MGKVIRYKEIKEFPGYAVMSNGKVFSYKINPLILKPFLNKKTGYLTVSLYSENKRKVATIHRIVAKAFIPNPNNLSEVNHKHQDGDKTRNNFENLEWVTKSDNAIHSITVLGNPSPPSMIGRLGKLSNSAKPIIQMKDGKIINKWDSGMDASRAGFNFGHISSCCRHERKSHKGFQWKFSIN